MTQSMVPHLTVQGAPKAIEFYKAGLGADEIMRMPHEDGVRLMHAALSVNGQHLYLCDDFPEYCGGHSSAPTGSGTPVTIHLSVADADAAIGRMEQAGATVTMPAADMFWGDRYGRVRDPFGHEWSFSHPLKKVA